MSMTKTPSAAVLGLSLFALAACRPGPDPSERPDRSDPRAWSIDRLDPRFDALVPADARFEVVAEGFDWVEGPLWLADQQRLLFSNIPANEILAWSQGGGVEVFREHSGYSGSEPFAGREPGSNGLALDPQGRLIICQHGDRRLVRVEADGSLATLASHYQGRRLNSPNDVVVHSSGALYFTDPPFGLPETFDDPDRELPFSGVYRVDEGEPVELLIDELGAPNGIALSPDERTLYVSDVDPARPAWWSFPLSADGTVGPGTMLRDAATFMDERQGGPDGIETDAGGNLFTAGPEGIYVFSPGGDHLGTLRTGVPTANLEWGDDGSTLFVAAGSQILRIALSTTSGRRARSRDLIVSANDAKFVRDNGRGTYPPDAGTDSLTVLDATTLPPKVVATVPVAHTIHGPPQSVAITPDGSLAFVSAPDEYDYEAGTQTKLSFIQVVDLRARRPEVIARVDVGGHPQGLSVSPDGRLLLAATTAGHVAVLTIRRRTVALKSRISLGEGKLSGISFTHDGRTALVANRDAQGISVLEIDGDQVRDTKEWVSSGVTPYAIDVSADGRWAVVSNVGLAAIEGRDGPLHGGDADSVTLIDTSTRPFRAVQHITTPAIPEGVAISPDGRYVAALTMAGSNLPADALGHAPRGKIALYEITDGRAELVATADSGVASQGLVFTRDGRHLIVQFNVERALALFEIEEGRLVDTGTRIPLTGGPTSIRTTPR